MKDYYAILRVSRVPIFKPLNARTACWFNGITRCEPLTRRRLSFIREINEAYDVLSDSVKKIWNDYRLVNPYQTYTQQQQPQKSLHPLRNRDPVFQAERFSSGFQEAYQIRSGVALFSLCQKSLCFRVEWYAWSCWSIIICPTYTARFQSRSITGQVPTIFFWRAIHSGSARRIPVFWRRNTGGTCGIAPFA